MILSIRVVLSGLFVCLLAGALMAQKTSENADIVVPKLYKAPIIENSAELQEILNTAASETLSSFAAKGFKPANLAVTLINLRDPDNLKIAEIRGNERIYPASVVKMFYMAALERQLEDKKVAVTPELERGLRDMIVDSSNEATQYILDVLTQTSSGAEMPQKEFEAWQYKRDRVNRYFAAMGYNNINVNQKTFCEDAYGIEQQSRGYKGQNRNMLTTNAAARLLLEIVMGRIADPERTRRMMNLMKRDPFAGTNDSDDQAHGFTGKALFDKKMANAKLWSKAGWTSKTRHDAAYIETADGDKFVIVVFTENNANEREIIPMIAGKVIDGLRR